MEEQIQDQIQHTPLTSQEAFNEVWKHFVVEKNKPGMGRASEEDGEPDHEVFVCKYRGENGTKCAVGCLIPDDLYDPSMEGKNVNDIVIPHSPYPRVCELFENVDPELLRAMQSAHDNLDGVLFHEQDSVDTAAAMKKKLQDIARAYKLTIPETIV